MQCHQLPRVWEWGWRSLVESYERERESARKVLFSWVISERGPHTHHSVEDCLVNYLLSLSWPHFHSPFSAGKMRNLLLTLPPMEIAPLFTVATWWDQINASTRWQNAVFFFLCAAYALVASIALVHSLSSSPSSTLFYLIHWNSNYYTVVAVFVLFCSALLLIVDYAGSIGENWS